MLLIQKEPFFMDYVLIVETKIILEENMNRKKTLIFTISLCLIMALFTGCKGRNDENDGKLKIVTTVFPAYDWTANVLGDKKKDADLTMLLDKGVDLHSYQPTADDIAKIAECDVFVYVGGESDGWVDDALKEAKNKKIKVINLMDVVGNKAKEEEVKEGMEPEKEEEHEEDGKEEKEYDEHIWLSLRNAKLCATAIEKSIAEVDNENKAVYKDNLERYCKSLDELDREYKDVVKNSENKTLIFGDRFPFRYMASDYVLDYYAAFVGCSAETEASFKTIKFLAKKMDETGAKSIMTIEGSNKKIAKTVLENTTAKNQEILEMNSMQSIKKSDVDKGQTYLGIMQNNLEVLKKALK